MDICPNCNAPTIVINDYTGERVCTECDWSDALTESIPDDPEVLTILHKEHIL